MSTPDAAPVEVEGGRAKVAGSCPLCGGSLFLGSGGWITCSWISCPNPTYLADLTDPAKRPTAPTTPDIADERVRGMLREAQEFVDAHCADDLSRRIDVALAHCPVCDAEDGPDRDCPTHGKAEGVREP